MKGKLLTICAAVVFVLAVTSAAQATEVNEVWVNDYWIWDEIFEVCYYEYEGDFFFCVENCIFDTIQEGIEGVDPCGTVNVLEGTYNEHIINQFPPSDKSFDLIGEGADVVTWTAPSGQYPLQLDQQSGVTYKVSGFTFVGDAAHCIKFAGGGFDDLNVYDNVFETINEPVPSNPGEGGYGLFMCRIVASRDGEDVSSIRVHDNVFNSLGGICMSNTKSFDIYDNEFNVDVEGIRSNAGCCCVGWTIGDHKLYGNTFSGMSGDAITLDYFTGGFTYLVSAINYNNFESIGGYAVNVTIDRGVTENAWYNWWGDPSGPGPVGPGSGDAVSTNVDFCAWALDPDCTDFEPPCPHTDIVVVDNDWAGLPDDTNVTAPGVDPSCYTIGYNAFDTIQEGIDNVDSSTVIVLPGTYNENLVINRSDITLRSAEGRDNTIITHQSSTKVGVDFRAGADNCVLGGEAGHGFTMVKDSLGFVIQLTNAPSGVEISHNTINNTGLSSMGINIGAAGADGLKVIKNEFIAEDGDGSIYGWSASNMFVCGNTFTGPDTTYGYAVQLSGMNASDITNNTIDGYGMGIFLQAAEGPAGVSDVTISNNRVRNCAKGIRLGYYLEDCPDVCDVIVTDNELRFNTVGIYVSDSNDVVADTFVIKDNRIAENTDGLKNDNDVYVVDATNNWWGDPCGPGPVGPGSGDSVSVNVDYDPWCDCGSTVHPCLDSDLNHDGTVNLLDFAISAEHWLEGPTPWCE